MPHSWLSYLPPHLAADLLAHPNTSPLNRVLRTNAVALFADISGFTPISEALRSAGSNDTEELSQILNRTFGAMIDIIYRYGGSIGKFAGDALTVVFLLQGEAGAGHGKQGSSPDPRAPIRRAIQCAIDMQAVLSNIAELHTSAGTFRLTMKIGLGMGVLFTTTVGDPSIRLEYLLAGSAIDRCITAERHAPCGAVVVCDEMMPLVGSNDSSPVAAGFHMIKRLYRLPSAAPWPEPPSLTSEIVATIGRYLPLSITQRLLQGRQGFVDEYRVVTTMFVKFVGFDYHDTADLGHLQHYLREVIQISDRYGGYLRQVDMGDKGSLYIVLFGAPLSHEDDTERALLCALDLRSAASRRGISTATGITTGRIFCGLIGSDVRREYAAIGDSVNLAARLMSAAQEGQILVDTATRWHRTRLFQWRDLAPLTVKGKAVPVAVAALEQRLQRRGTRLRAPGYALPLVGRAAELSRCVQLFEQARLGQGQLIGISAEAGVGKSRLVAELLRYAARQQVRYITGECLSYGTASSYLVWQQMLRELFGLTSDMPAEMQIARLIEVLHSIDEQLISRISLLAPLLSLPVAESDVPLPQEVKVRKSALHALLIDCLRCWAKRQPLLLVLEDCHWIDELSQELLLAVAERCTDVPLVLLLTYRPTETASTVGQHIRLRFRSLSILQELRLQEFTATEAEQFIRLKLEQLFGHAGDVPPMLLERITEQTQGTPFYIDELLNLIRDRGIDLSDRGALEQLELPECLQRLILSRIDRLEEGPKTVLKVAGVIGRVFKAQWLWQLDLHLGGVSQVRADLNVLHELDLLELKCRESEEYLFKHPIIWEVAYESLAINTRAVLHEQVGQFIERMAGDEVDRYLDQLVYHYGNSPNLDKQREYYWRAGQAAKIAYANAAAASYFSRLLPLMTDDERGEVLLALAEVEELLGRLDTAEQSVRSVLDLAARRHNTKLAAQAARVYGIILRDACRYDQALAYLEQSRQQFMALEDDDELVATLTELHSVYTYQGAYEQARATAQTCLDLATAIGNQLGCCRSLNCLGACHGEQGQPTEAITYFERAIPIATKHGYLYMLSTMIGNLGAAYSDLGDNERSFDQHLRKLDIVLPLGIQEEIIASFANMAVNYSRFGQYIEARLCNEAGLAFMGEPLKPRHLAWVIGNLAHVNEQQGNDVLAGQLYDYAIAISRSFGLGQRRAVILHLQAKYYLSQQRLAEAQIATHEALDLAKHMQIRNLQLLAELLALRIKVLLGQIDAHDALAQLEQVRLLCTQPADHAFVSYTSWKIEPAHAAVREVATAQYRTLYAESPNVLYRQRYLELTGELLPPPPLLPAPPPIVQQYTFDLPALLRRVDQLLGEQLEEPGKAQTVSY